MTIPNRADTDWNQVFLRNIQVFFFHMNTKVMARLLTSDYSRTEKLPKETSHIKAEMTSALCHLLYTYYSRGKKKRSCSLPQNSTRGRHHSSETTGDNILLSARIKIFCLQWKWIFIRFSVRPSAAFSVVDGTTGKFFSHLLKSNNWWHQIILH